MKVVILQSNYIPWRGYFDLINDADIFVYYDEVQYTKNDWRNRNRIYTAPTPQWLTIPVGLEAVKNSISAVELKDHRWQQTHYRTLTMGYARAAFSHQLQPLIEEAYLQNEWKRLVEVDRFFIEKIAKLIGIETKFIDSATLPLEGDRVMRLINLLTHLKADTYISGPAAKNYLATYEHLFAEKGISLVYKDYSNYPEYPQLRAPFEPAVSILDLIANVELTKIKDYIWTWRT